MSLAVTTPYTVPIGFMDALQITLLVLVAAGATVVVLTRRHVHQVLALSVYGVLLAVLFLAFQAPDVTLSELTVGAVALPIILLLTLAKTREARRMTPAQRRWIFVVAAAGLVGFYLWGLSGLPGFGNYPGPYGFVILRLAVPQTNATGVVSTVNFEYRGFDTVGEEFILFAAATGVATVLRRLRGERERSAVDEAADRDVPSTSGAVRMVALLFTGPVLVAGWWLATHAQANPSGGFQGGVILATAFILVYLSGEFLVFKRFSPVALTDAVEAVGAGGFAAVGLAAVPMGLAFLTNYLPLGQVPGAVSSSGTIALISFFVGLEVGAAFILIIGEMLDQTLLIKGGNR